MIFKKLSVTKHSKLFLNTSRFVGISVGMRVPSNRSIFEFRRNYANNNNNNNKSTTTVWHKVLPENWNVALFSVSSNIIYLSFSTCVLHISLLNYKTYQ
jgi:hypothetical protein